MKIVLGKDALIAIALGFKVYIRSKSSLGHCENQWKEISDQASISLFLRDSELFEFGVIIDKQ